MSTFLITGSSRSIGREIAKEAHKAGHNVVINYVKNDACANELKEELGERTIVVKADVSNEDEVKKMFSVVKERFGGVDVLVNNAGIARFHMMQDIPAQEWDEIFNTNVKGTFLTCREAIPYMVEKKNGVIINISSIWGLVGASCEVAYSSSKGAIIAMTKALAKELGPSGIRVNCVAPGVIETDMNASLGEDALKCLKEETPLERLGAPKDIASCVLFLASENASFITGQVISPNGGFVI